MRSFRRKSVNRRSFVRGASAVTGSALTFPMVRNTFAQTPDASPAASPVGGETTIVSSVEGVPNAYLAYPESFKSVEEAPGDGSTVKMLTLSYRPPAPAKDENPYWQELESRLNVTWEADMVPIDTYNERIATTLAGGDLPDLFFLLPSTSRPIIYDALRQGAFLDMTEIVESGKIKEYSNLAEIPDYMWEATRFEGKIWGVPKPVLRNNDVAFWRKDWGSTLGSESLDSSDSLHDYLVGVSTKDPDGNGNDRDTWGFAPYGGNWNNFLLNQSFAVPYGWRLNDDGSLTAAHETDEYQAALEMAARLFTDGAYHPDSATIDVAMATSMMQAGQVGMATNGFAAVFGNTGFRTTVKETMPDAELEALVMPGVDGGQGVTYQTTGIFGYTALPGAIAGDEERIDVLLKVLNYLYAPFGSEESTFLRYGVEGVHSELGDDGGYVVTEEGKSQQSALVYPFLSENYFYYPGAPEEAVAAQKHNEAMAEVAVANPCALLFSPAQGESGATIGQLMTDVYTEVVTGRSGIDALETARTEWRDRGGDQIRAEYEELLAAEQ